MQAHKAWLLVEAFHLVVVKGHMGLFAKHGVVLE